MLDYEFLIWYFVFLSIHFIGYFVCNIYGGDLSQNMQMRRFFYFC